MIDALKDRESWFRVEVVTRPNGSWDIMLRIDGTYSGNRFDPEEMRAYWAEKLEL